MLRVRFGQWGIGISIAGQARESSWVEVSRWEVRSDRWLTLMRGQQSPLAQWLVPQYGSRVSSQA